MDKIFIRKIDINEPRKRYGCGLIGDSGDALDNSRTRILDKQVLRLNFGGQLTDFKLILLYFPIILLKIQNVF